MKLITRICCLFLMLYPLIGMGNNFQREIFVYIYHPDSYWHHHPEEASDNNVSLRLNFDAKQVKYSQELQEDQKWYQFEVETLDNTLPASLILQYRNKSKIVSIPAGSSPLIIAILNEKVFPYEVKVFQEHEIQDFVYRDKMRIEGLIPLTNNADQIIKEKISLLFPFADLNGIPTSYQVALKPDLEWEHAHFKIEALSFFNTIAFLKYQERYYPILTKPEHHYKIQWTSSQASMDLSYSDRQKELEDALASIDKNEMSEEEYSQAIEQLTNQLDYFSELIDKAVAPSGLSSFPQIDNIEGGYHYGANPQDFFNNRYPYGLSETAYEELVNAFIGDLSTRTDTLFAWSRAIVEYYKAQDENPEHLLKQINEIGRQSKKDIFERGYEEYVDRKWMLAEVDSRNWEAFLIISFILSLFVYVSMIVLRLMKSQLILPKHINLAEGTVFGMLSTVFLYFGMHTNHHGIIEIASLSYWVLCASPLVIFYLNMRYLVPTLLLKKRWGMYIFTNMGFTFIYFLAAVSVAYTPLDHYGLCFVDNDWQWIWAQNKFEPNFHPDGGIMIHLILLAFAPAYGLGRHALFNRMPKLQRQKSALKAELNNLKTQISPHFFFNSLNTVYGFALGEDSPRTAEAITKLSDMMRFAIYHGDKDQISLGKELDYLADYVELQQLRLNPVRHELKFNIEGESGDLQIAPLLLITLVENAFKHGISMSHDSFIYIDLFIQSEGLILTVENSVHAGQLVPANAPEKQEGGVGLANTQQRLDLLYKNRYEWVVEQDEDRYYTQLSIDLTK